MNINTNNICNGENCVFYSQILTMILAGPLVPAVKMGIDTWNIEPAPQALGHSCYWCVHWLSFKLTVFTIDEPGRNGPGLNENKSD